MRYIKQNHVVGERLRRAREEMDMSQDELGRLVGVTGSAISQMERGYVAFRLSDMERLARVLGKDLSFFTGDRKPLPRRIEAVMAELGSIAPVAVPVVGSVHAGWEEDVVEYAYWARSRAADKNIVGLEVRGFCLEPHIREGDRVFLDREASPRSGSIVLYIRQGEAGLARYYQREGTVWIETNYGRVDPGEVTIRGVVLEVSRRLE
jgi:transcriptional regulator with XRE-family HTH domain